MDVSSDSVVTDVKFASALSYVPPRYSVISHTANSSEDANLWKDRLLTRRTRYLCFKRENISHCTPRTPVLVHLLLTHEGEIPPTGFKPIIEALGTGERALKKKTLCAKYIPLDAAQSSVTDIIIHSRYHKTATGLTCVGELNSLMILCKTSPLNKKLIGTASTSTLSSSRSSLVRPPTPPATPDAASMTAFATKRRGNIHPLSGIPFLLSKKYAGEDSSTIDELLNSIPVKTKEQIENEYDYRFTAERSLLRSC